LKSQLQELSGHVLGYSIQTANSFEVISVVGGGEHVLNCREVQDLQAIPAFFQKPGNFTKFFSNGMV